MIRKIILILGIFGVLFFYTYEQIQILRMGYAITEKEKKLRDLRQENMELLIKNSRLKSPKRIETISKEKLGLVAAKKVKIVYLSAPKKELSSPKSSYELSLPSQTRISKTKHFISRILENIFFGGQNEVEAEIVIQ
ncbi:septum formation initiator family protein [PVC group bacterium]|nr:septum formation initiator family protein [PVC group bacterium]